MAQNGIAAEEHQSYNRGHYDPRTAVPLIRHAEDERREAQGAAQAVNRHTR